MKDPFFVQGALKLSNSACVLCLRQRNTKKRTLTLPDILTRAYVSDDKAKQVIQKQPYISKIIERGPLEFLYGWEILLGQNEVINYLRSTPTKLKTMSFAGEFKFPGGVVDEHESIEEAAERELFEEILTPGGIDMKDKTVILHPFSVKQTRPIRSKSSLMHNFVCFESENDWLQNLNIDEVNKNLKKKRDLFKQSISNSSYWSLSQEEKEKLSPEVHTVQWMPLSEAILCSLTSFLPGFFVNDWQEKQFDFLSKNNAEKKRKKRDPMMITAATMMEVEYFRDSVHCIEFCKRRNLTNLREETQWLFEGMNNDQVVEATKMYFQRDDLPPTYFYNDLLIKRRLNRSKL